MEAIHWVIVFLVLCILVSFIAAKKGRSGVKLFFAVVLPAVPLMMLISYVLGNNMEAKPLAMWSAAFLCPVAGFGIDAAHQGLFRLFEQGAAHVAGLGLARAGQQDGKGEPKAGQQGMNTHRNLLW